MTSDDETGPDDSGPDLGSDWTTDTDEHVQVRESDANRVCSPPSRRLPPRRVKTDHKCRWIDHESSEESEIDLAAADMSYTETYTTASSLIPMRKEHSAMDGEESMSFAGRFVAQD